MSPIIRRDEDKYKESQPPVFPTFSLSVCVCVCVFFARVIFLDKNRGCTVVCLACYAINLEKGTTVLNRLK